MLFSLDKSHDRMQLDKEVEGVQQLEKMSLRHSLEFFVTL